MRLDVIPSEFLLDRAALELELPTTVDDYRAEVEAEYGFGADPLKALENDVLREFAIPDLLSINNLPAFDDVLLGEDLFDDSWADELGDDLENLHHRKDRNENEYKYKFGNVFEANWYRQFLCPDARDKTYRLSSRDNQGEFRCLFRMPLSKVDDLVSTFLENGWVPSTRKENDDETFQTRAELLILAALNVLGHHTPFRALRSSTEICYSTHLKFFQLFLDKMYSIKDDVIYYPRSMEELSSVSNRYANVSFPGCGGSIDVVHMKWSYCPAGDFNRCKGKEGYPTLAFEVVTGFDREIFGISSVQFGTRNDKHIVKLDETVNKIKNDWYSTVEWQYYDVLGNLHNVIGIYLICDGGYLRWPILVCPFQHESAASQKGYFSARLESIRKDVECVFGILKKRWRILEFGIRFRDIKIVEKVFVVCAMLHNIMLTEMKTTDTQFRVGRGSPNPGDAVWLRGPVPLPAVRNGGERHMAMEWGKRRQALAGHVEYMARSAKRRRLNGL